MEKKTNYRCTYQIKLRQEKTKQKYKSFLYNKRRLLTNFLSKQFPPFWQRPQRIFVEIRGIVRFEPNHFFLLILYFPT